MVKPKPSFIDWHCAISSGIYVNIGELLFWTFLPCRTLQQKSWHFLSRELELYAFCQPMVLSLLSHFVSHQLQVALSHTRFSTFSVLCMCWYRYTYRFILNWDYIKTHTLHYAYKILHIIKWQSFMEVLWLILLHQCCPSEIVVFFFLSAKLLLFKC